MRKQDKIIMKILRILSNKYTSSFKSITFKELFKKVDKRDYLKVAKLLSDCDYILGRVEKGYNKPKLNESIWISHEGIKALIELENRRMKEKVLNEHREYEKSQITKKVNDES